MRPPKEELRQLAARLERLETREQRFGRAYARSCAAVFGVKAEMSEIAAELLEDDAQVSPFCRRALAVFEEAGVAYAGAAALLEGGDVTAVFAAPEVMQRMLEAEAAIDALGITGLVAITARARA